MRSIDFTSWQTILSTLLGLIVVSVVAVGIRLLVMQGVQQRRERQNRQINERLKTLIAAYKTLGGSFTGDLAVDPRHRRELRAAREAREEPALAPGVMSAGALSALNNDNDDAPADGPGADRRRRVRDAVEAALSDVILLGTEAQVRLAARAADEMVAGRSVEIAELVISLRDFIRDVLDLDPIPGELSIPRQGPVRAMGGGGKAAGGARADGGAGAKSGGGRGGAGAGAGVGVDLGGAGFAQASHASGVAGADASGDPAPTGSH